MQGRDSWEKETNEVSSKIILVFYMEDHSSLWKKERELKQKMSVIQGWEDRD